jgi:hypothetical protein
MVARVVLVLMILTLPFSVLPKAIAQDAPNLVGLMRVDAPGVEVRRVNTQQWVAVKTETLIAAGDSIRTTDKGRAIVTFFDGILSTSVQNSSEIRLNIFNGQADAFTAEVQVVRGFVDFSSQRTLTESAVFRVVMPTFQVIIASGGLRTRVEESNRSAALNISNGQATAQWKDAPVVSLTQNTGVRLATEESAADVVPAVSFPTLDSAIDGCETQTTVEGDVLINVRDGAGLSYKAIGGIDGKSKVQAMGITGAGDWYRIRYGGAFGWINVSRLVLSNACAGLRRYNDGAGEAGATPAPQPALTGTPTATPAPK